MRWDTDGGRPDDADEFTIPMRGNERIARLPMAAAVSVYDPHEG